VVCGSLMRSTQPCVYIYVYTYMCVGWVGWGLMVVGRVYSHTNLTALSMTDHTNNQADTACIYIHINKHIYIQKEGIYIYI
jgi:hypothetical protein